VRVIAATTALIAASVPIADARAATLFDVFRALCLDSKGDPQIAMARADAMGWRRTSPQLVSALTRPSERGEKVTAVDSRGMQDLRGAVAVVVARTSRMVVKQEIPAQVCILAAAPMDGDAVQAEAAAYAVVDHKPGLAFQKKARSYLWRETADRHEPIEVDDISAAGDPRDVRMMVVMGGNKADMGVLELFVPVKEQN
jgi:hypothetical protein